MKFISSSVFIISIVVSLKLLAQIDPQLQLTIAAGHGDTATVRSLLDQGVNPNSADESGITPLMYAAHSGSTATVKLLIERGANVNAKSRLLGYTALMNAAGFGDVEMVRALLHAGARINERNDDGATALTFAQQAGKSANVNLLRQRGAVN